MVEGAGSAAIAIIIIVIVTVVVTIAIVVRASSSSPSVSSAIIVVIIVGVIVVAIVFHRQSPPSSSSPSSSSSSSSLAIVVIHVAITSQRLQAPAKRAVPRDVARARRGGRVDVRCFNAPAASGADAESKACRLRGWHWRSSPRWPCAALRHFSVAQASNRTFGFCWWHAALGVPRKAGRGTLARASEPATAQ